MAKFDLREKIFNNRSYTPIPLLIAVLIFARPSVWSILAGIGLMAVGEFWRLWAVRYAGGATRTTSGVGGDELVTAGPYAHLRNPLYLGNLFNALGICVAAWAWMPWMLIVCLEFFAVQYGLIISLEEEYLGNRFAEAYRVYSSNVPRFVPRFDPWRGAAVAKPQPLREAIRTERHTLGSLTLITLLIVLRWKVF